MEQIEKNFINSFQSILAKEGKEICKEFETQYTYDEDYIKSKAYSCCRFVESHSSNPELIKRCQDYMDKVHDFNRYESTFNAIKSERKDKIDLSNMKLKKI